MTRIAQGQLSRRLLADVMRNYKDLDRASKQVSSGYKVERPGDSDVAGSIQNFRNTLQKVESYQKGIGITKAALGFQEDIVKQVAELVGKAKELATQAANETVDTATRRQMATEVFQIREQLVQFANARYQDRYIYGQADDDDPPYDQASVGYTVPTTGDSSVRYVFDGELGTSLAQNVNVTEDIAVRVSSSAQTVFGNSITALETLGRALEGFDTTLAGTPAVPTGAGVAYDLPNQRSVQTGKIQESITLVDAALTNDIIPERIDIGARLSRIEVAEAVLDSTKQTAVEGLNTLQNADSATAISQFQQAQYSLQAAMQVTSRVLNLSILDYL
jgi:flagellar hook-associated protein 3 FlgL